MTRRILNVTKFNLTCSLILLSLLVTGQNLTITGTVLSGEDQQPLIGVNVVVVGTQDGTITDFNGVYTVSAPADAVLQFSYTGFVTQDVNVGGRTTICLLYTSRCV